jgi:hypothetical protein
VCQNAIFYLHGFASGPSSAKAKQFSEKLPQLGFRVTVPDLNKPTFEEMTLTSQLAEVEGHAQSVSAETGLVVIGSSMGGLIATLFAQNRPQVKALILMAPGFELLERWKQWLGDAGIEKWKQDGLMLIDHHSYAREMPLRYSFLEDARQYDTDNLHVNTPTLIFHGRNDTVVPLASSIRFKKRNSEFVQLIELEDDHQLLRSMRLIWPKCEDFLNEHGLV